MYTDRQTDRQIDRERERESETKTGTNRKTERERQGGRRSHVRPAAGKQNGRIGAAMSDYYWEVLAT